MVWSALHDHLAGAPLFLSFPPICFFLFSFPFIRFPQFDRAVHLLPAAPRAPRSERHARPPHHVLTRVSECIAQVLVMLCTICRERSVSLLMQSASTAIVARCTVCGALQEVYLTPQIQKHAGCSQGASWLHASQQTRNPEMSNPNTS